jgi:hypothetical protein
MNAKEGKLVHEIILRETRLMGKIGLRKTD